MLSFFLEYENTGIQEYKTLLFLEYENTGIREYKTLLIPLTFCACETFVLFSCLLVFMSSFN